MFGGKVGVPELLLLLSLLILMTYIIPVSRILRRTGHSGWWCLLTFIPLVNLIALWLFAYIRWPAERQWKQSV